MKLLNRKKLILVAMFLIAMGCTAAAGRTIYVDADASTGGNGLTWGTAYKYLQDALLADAASGDQVWVAAGTYKPDQDEGGNVTPGNRNDSFKLIDSVGIYGGFPSDGAWEDRDPNTYETILSGDIGLPDATSDNSYHIVEALGTEETAVLDGFVITGGNANGNASEQQWGAGMLNIGSDPTVTNCTFTGNKAESGGGMCSRDGSNPTVTNCTFCDNIANSVGGGMSNAESSPTVTDCAFTGNEAAYNGGGMLNSNWSSPTVTNCTFRDNIANFGGGMHSYISYPTVTDCTFTGNEAERGGGMYSSTGSTTVINCTFCDNIANIVGGGMYNRDSDLTVTNCTFTGNSASEDGGGMYNDSRGCVFCAKIANIDGSGMYSVSRSPTVTNCTFTNNTALGESGGGGGMYNLSGSPTVTNCTFTGNSASKDGGGISLITDSNALITNSILWADSPNEVSIESGSSASITYSDIQGAWLGQGNINTDPCFADADANDYHLKSQAGRWDPNSQSWITDANTSPCIDAGDTASPIGYEPFPNGGIINMGAYGGTAKASKSYFGTTPCEIIVAGDINGDCKVNFLDFALMAFHWLEER